MANWNNYIFINKRCWNIQWAVLFHEVTRFFDPVVLQIHVKYFSCCITTTARPMAIKLDKVVTYYKKLQPITSHNPLNRAVTFNEELLSYSHLTLWLRGLAISLIRFLGLEHKHLIRHRLLVIYSKITIYFKDMSTSLNF